MKFFSKIIGFFIVLWVGNKMINEELKNRGWA